MVVLTMLLREVEFEKADKNYNIEQAGMDGWFNVRPIGFQVRVRPRV
jgi:hypothetical protein